MQFLTALMMTRENGRKLLTSFFAGECKPATAWLQPAKFSQFITQLNVISVHCMVSVYNQNTCKVVQCSV
jgi:hypothetical protein